MDKSIRNVKAPISTYVEVWCCDSCGELAVFRVKSGTSYYTKPTHTCKFPDANIDIACTLRPYTFKFGAEEDCNRCSRKYSCASELKWREHLPEPEVKKRYHYYQSGTRRPLKRK